MIIYEPTLKVYRNDFNQPTKKPVVILQRFQFRHEVGYHEEINKFWLGFRCSFSILEAESYHEIFGHLSEWRSIVLQDSKGVEREKLIPFAQRYFKECLQDNYHNNRPRNFDYIQLKEPDYNKAVDGLIKCLLEIGFQ